MKRLIYTEEMEGRVIKEICENVSDVVVIIFHDETYAAVQPRFYGDSFDLEWGISLDDHEMRDAGIITQVEYDKLQATKLAKEQCRREERELEQLKALKAKYE